MYFFFGDGLIGNQLFQYAFLKTIIKKKSLIISTNLQEVNNFLIIDKKINLIDIKNKYLIFLFRRIFIWFFVIFSSCKIFSSINVERKNLYGTKIEKKKIVYKKGLLDITFIYPRFFQSEFFFKEKRILDYMDIKDMHLNKANLFLSKIPKKKEKIFIHYRQGRRDLTGPRDNVSKYTLEDYKKIKFLGLEGIALPDKYYTEMIKFFKKRVKNPYFIILTDNTDRAKKTFFQLKEKIISHNNQYVDLTIMSCCQNGIMSNSSISWWGGFLMKKRKILIGAKYWLGWKRKITFQAGGEPSFAKLIDPNKFI